MDAPVSRLCASNFFASASGSRSKILFTIHTLADASIGCQAESSTNPKKLSRANPLDAWPQTVTRAIPKANDCGSEPGRLWTARYAQLPGTDCARHRTRRGERDSLANFARICSGFARDLRGNLRACSARTAREFPGSGLGFPIARRNVSRTVHGATNQDRVFAGRELACWGAKKQVGVVDREASVAHSVTRRQYAGGVYVGRCAKRGERLL